MFILTIGLLCWIAAYRLLLVKPPEWVQRAFLRLHCWIQVHRHRRTRRKPTNPNGLTWAERLHGLGAHAATVLVAWLVTSAEASPERNESVESLERADELTEESPFGLGQKLWLRLTGIGAALVMPARKVPWVAIGLICLVLSCWFMLRNAQPPAQRALRKPSQLRTSKHQRRRSQTQKSRKC